MIEETIKAIEEDKLHEVVIRISQMSFDQLGQLAVAFLSNDYTKMYAEGRRDEIVSYDYELPNAYTLTFRLMEDEGDYTATIEFSTDKPSKFFDEEKNTLFIFPGPRYYWINMVNRNKGWRYSGMQGRRNRLFHLLTEYV